MVGIRGVGGYSPRRTFSAELSRVDPFGSLLRVGLDRGWNADSSFPLGYAVFMFFSKHYGVVLFPGLFCNPEGIGSFAP